MKIQRGCPPVRKTARPLAGWALAALAVAAVPLGLWAQSPAPAPAPAQWVDLFNGKDLTGWDNINTAEDTWKWRDGMLVCTGKPIGVMCSRKQYENFVLHIEWMHMEAGGNSGVFVWSAARPGAENRLPDGVEVAIQEEPRGTGDAVAAAASLLDPTATVVVINGDVALLTAEAIRDLVKAHEG